MSISGHDGPGDHGSARLAGEGGLHGSSRLFLVRLRAEESREGQVEWCGQVQRVVNGEAYEFRGWSELVERLQAMLSG